MQAELIYNPRGGQVVVRHELDDVVTLLSRCGWSVALRETSKPLEATELARHAAHRGAKVVIAAGGDGTVNEVANGLFNTDVALGACLSKLSPAGKKRGLPSSGYSISSISQ